MISVVYKQYSVILFIGSVIVLVLEVIALNTTEQNLCVQRVCNSQNIERAEFEFSFVCNDFFHTNISM